MTEDRYVFLNCSEYEPEERSHVACVLRDLGCEVRYDEHAGEARPWRSGILDAIEGCSLFFEVNHNERDCTIGQELAKEFAYKLRKPMVFVYLYDRLPEKREDTPAFFDSSLKDPEFPEKCRRGLEAEGFFSGKAVPMPEEHYDLGMTYYRDRRDWELSWSRKVTRDCNLRTHEAWGFPTYRPLTDEEVYCAVRWTRERFYLISRSDQPDYKPNREDRKFTEMIDKRKGEAPAELERQYVREPYIPEPHPPFPAGYPDKDEFEYLGSDDDD